MERLYLITINWVQAPDTAKIEAVLPGKWLRFSQTTWLLWSTSTTFDVYSAVSKKLTAADTEIVILTNENDWYAFAQPWVEKWIRSHGNSTT